MSSIFLANRYLTTHRGNRFMSWITFLSVTGISIGIAAMIVVLSVINGFEREFRRGFLAGNAHILAFQFPRGLNNVESMIETIQNDFGKDLAGMSPFVHSESMATNDSLMHNVLIRGIAPERRRKVQDLDRIIHPPEAQDILQRRMSLTESEAGLSKAPIILGAGLASILGLKVGDDVKLVRPESNSLGELRAFEIVGLYKSGFKHYDNRLGIMSLPDSQALLSMKGRVHGIDIGLINPDDSKIIAAKMSDKYTLTIKEWQSFNKDMFESMEMERSVIGLIVALVAFVASFNILTTLFIIVTITDSS